MLSLGLTNFYYKFDIIINNFVYALYFVVIMSIYLLLDFNVVYLL